MTSQSGSADSRRIQRAIAQYALKDKHRKRKVSVAQPRLDSASWVDPNRSVSRRGRVESSNPRTSISFDEAFDRGA